MQVAHQQRLNETLFHERLQNGLEVYIIPKLGFQKTYATFTTKYGSIDNTFQVKGGARVEVPDGIAHFLEHKMFEEPDGDVFNRFAQQGASANAFTTFNRTTYLFSATGRIDENITTLLDFVQHPYFTDQNVEKEKGIIGQEIKMYEDDPDWRVYFGLIQSLYGRHPIRIDIAGTLESIENITKEMLYTCYQTFYHPTNMIFVVVGGVDPEKTLELIKENQAKKTYPEQSEIIRFYPDEPAEVHEQKRVIGMSVGLPKCYMGFKEIEPGLTGQALLRKELATQLLLDAVIGPGTQFYQELYNQGVIDEGFGFDYTAEPGYAHSMIGGDTRDPEALVEAITNHFEHVLQSGVNEDDLERSKRKRMGGFLRGLNSPEFIANQFTRCRLNGADFFQILPVLESLTINDITKRMSEHFNMAHFAVSIVRSKA